MNKSTELYQFSPDVQLEYVVYGRGEKTLICFHGFGQNQLVFKELESNLSEYRTISVNLFFHGKSTWTSKNKYLSHSEWKKILSSLLEHLNISRFSILGYSMGGRYTASTIHSFSDRIDHCFFIAPDGIVKRRSYEFATFPLGSQQLFSYFMNNPKPFFVFLNLLEKTRLLNPWTIKFSRSQLNDESQRLRVLRCWIALKYLRLRQSELVKCINDSKFQTHIIFGKYDRIIIPERHQNFFNQLNTASVSIIESPHHELIDDSIDIVKRALEVNL